MKVTYTSKSGQLSFEFDAKTPKEVFTELEMASLFDEPCCGLCGCESIRCAARKSKDGKFTFYEMKCQNPKCGARLEFGQNKDMVNLFAKRTAHPESNGWSIYHGEDSHEDAPPAPRQQRTQQQQGKAPTNGKVATPTAPPTRPPPRTPAAPPSTPKAPPATRPGPSTPLPKKYNVLDEHRKVCGGYDAADSERDLQWWSSYAGKIDFAPYQHDEQQDHYNQALERLAMAQAPA